jgi:hypothetical protein
MPLTDSIARNAKPAAKAIRFFDHDGLLSRGLAARRQMVAP